MSQVDPDVMKEPSLPRRDRILLPLLSLFTIVLLAGGTEFIARRLYTLGSTGLASCMVINDTATGARGIPNTVCMEKAPEDRVPTIYKFNRCGHRAGMDCGAKPPGTYRIVMTGSSVAMGEHVQQEESFAALLPVDLSKATGRPVELYNEGMGWGFSHSTALRFNDALAQQPDMILWIMTPMDVQRASLVLPTEDIDTNAPLSLRAKAWIRVKAAFSGSSGVDAIAQVFSRTRTALVLRHFLYQSQSQYIKSALTGNDDGKGFLQADQNDLWKSRLQQFDKDAASMEERAKVAGVPFVAVLVPDRTEATMLSMGTWPAGYDPYKLGDELRAIIVSHGGTYIDILPDYRNTPNPEQYYLPVDGHPNASGHVILAEYLAKELTNGAVPALTVAAPTHIASGQGR